MTPDEFKQRQNELGYTNREIAHYLGVTIKAVEHWRSGRRGISGTIEKLLEWLEEFSEGDDGDG